MRVGCGVPPLTEWNVGWLPIAPARQKIASVSPQLGFDLKCPVLDDPFKASAHDRFPPFGCVRARSRHVVSEMFSLLREGFKPPSRGFGTVVIGDLGLQPLSIANCSQQTPANGEKQGSHGPEAPEPSRVVAAFDRFDNRHNAKSESGHVRPAELNNLPCLVGKLRHSNIIADGPERRLVRRPRRKLTHYHRTMSTTAEQMKIERAAQALIEATPAPAKVLLFGSHARGDASERSDFDFLVIEPEVDDRFGEMARLSRILGRLLIPADVVVVSAQYAQRWGAVKGTLLHEALREGHVIAES